MRLKFQKGDILAIVAVVILAIAVLLCFLPKGEGAVAEIYLEGEKIRTVDLSQDQEFTVEGRYHATVTVKAGKIAVTESDCPTGDCVATGWSKNRSIVCLPGALEIRIVAKSDDVDFVVG